MQEPNLHLVLIARPKLALNSFCNTEDNKIVIKFEKFYKIKYFISQILYDHKIHIIFICTCTTYIFYSKMSLPFIGHILFFYI